jgi:transmembrane sensor
MNSSQQHHDSVAEEQAALWAARLDGDTLDRTQRAELDRWLEQKPSHRTLLSQYCQFSADLEESIPTLVTNGRVAMPAIERPTRRWTFPRVFGFAIAAAAAVAVAVVVLRPEPQIQNIAMASAERGAQTLADGTRVELNANTSLRFENGQNERLVRLAGGEALFAVAKDPSRPFFVETPAGKVRVTGTTFNVRVEPGARGFEVSVVEGSVEVTPGEASGARALPTALLGANDQFSTRRGGQRVLTSSELEDALAWRDGKIVFYNVPLGEAVARFAHYHGRAINVAPELASEPIGGRHNIDDLSNFLSGIQGFLPRAKVNFDGSGAISITVR